MPFFSYYQPPNMPGGIGLCGAGDEWQANVQRTSNPTFELVTTPKAGQVNHWPELAALAAETNAAFTAKASALLKAKREAMRDRTLEITVWVTDRGFQLVYSKPARANRKPPPHLYGKRAPSKAKRAPSAKQRR